MIQSCRFSSLRRITLPMMGVLSIMAYIGSQLRRIWLSLPPFLLMGLYWLWRVELIAD